MSFTEPSRGADRHAPAAKGFIDDRPIGFSLNERRAASVARALRLTARPDSSFEYIAERKPKLGGVAAVGRPI